MSTSDDSPAEVTRCSKKRVRVGTHIEIHPGRYGLPFVVPKPGETPAETEARQFERWATDVREFIKDHRSCDIHEVSVEHEYEDQCSACGAEWEEDTTGGIVFCANCGAEVTR